MSIFFQSRYGKFKLKSNFYGVLRRSFVPVSRGVFETGAVNGPEIWTSLKMGFWPDAELVLKHSILIFRGALKLRVEKNTGYFRPAESSRLAAASSIKS